MSIYSRNILATVLASTSLLSVTQINDSFAKWKPLFLSHAVCDGKSETKKTKSNQTCIVVRLTPQSQLQLQEKLKSMRLIKDSSNKTKSHSGSESPVITDIIVKRAASPEDVRQLQSLYGNRVAFRMKGYVASKQGGFAGGFGSVRGMSPEEVAIQGFTPSFVIPPKGGKEMQQRGANSSNISDLSAEEVHFIVSSDLPTRLHQSQYYAKHLKQAEAAAADPVAGLANRGYYTGRLQGYAANTGTVGSSGCGASVDFPSVAVDAVQIPWEAQLVIEGHLCPLSCIEKGAEGAGGGIVCNYERQEELATATAATTGTAGGEGSNAEASAPPKAKRESADKNSSSSSSKDGENSGESVSKCPICYYIESGPCRKVFNDWEACMQSLGDAKESNKDGAAEADVSTCFPATSAMMACFSKHEYYDIMVAGLQDSIKNTYIAPAEAASEPAEVGTKTGTKSNA